MKCNKLSPREIKVLKAMTEYDCTKHAVEALGISKYTLANHLCHIRKKLEASNTSHAIRIAEKRGII
jgi:DNA-binding NarL/FixJ family response regulator